MYVIWEKLKVVGKMSIHGYVTGIQSDYIIFYSPVFKTMYIPFQHIKKLVPFQPSKTPYSLEKTMLPVNPSNLSIARTFEVQLKKLIGKIVVLDLGLVEHRIGRLKKIESNFVHLISAKEDVILINLNHIKSVHFE